MMNDPGEFHSFFLNDSKTFCLESLKTRNRSKKRKRNVKELKEHFDQSLLSKISQIELSQLISIAHRYSTNITNRILSSFNSCDESLINDFCTQYFSPDIILTYFCQNKSQYQNPIDSEKIIQGRSNIIKYWKSLFDSIPDNIFQIIDYDFKVLEPQIDFSQKSRNKKLKSDNFDIEISISFFQHGNQFSFIFINSQDQPQVEPDSKKNDVNIIQLYDNDGTHQQKCTDKQISMTSVPYDIPLGFKLEGFMKIILNMERKISQIDIYYSTSSSSKLKLKFN